MNIFLHICQRLNLKQLSTLNIKIIKTGAQINCPRSEGVTKTRNPTHIVYSQSEACINQTVCTIVFETTTIHTKTSLTYKPNDSIHLY